MRKSVDCMCENGGRLILMPSIGRKQQAQYTMSATLLNLMVLDWLLELNEEIQRELETDREGLDSIVRFRLNG